MDTVAPTSHNGLGLKMFRNCSHHQTKQKCILTLA